MKLTTWTIVCLQLCSSSSGVLKDTFRFMFFVMIGSQLLIGKANAQENSINDTKTILTLNSAVSLHSDSTKIVEDAPLDIAQDRGLFIIAPDQKMQLRILGSVRYLVVYDELKLQSKNAFNTYEIPTPTTGKRSLITIMAWIKRVWVLKSPGRHKEGMCLSGWKQILWERMDFGSVMPMVK